MDRREFEKRLAARARAVESVLDGILDPDCGAPARLLAAMRHGVLNGGKRLRPFLVLETAALLGGGEAAGPWVAAAVECVHCYSLIHDDLPAMDDDAMRRGGPTVHVAFDAATAILAGDALLALAFETVAAPRPGLTAAARTDLVATLARAAGGGGMVGGQALDLLAETSSPGEAGILALQAMKTGALIGAACEAGAILAGAPAPERARLRRFGETVGLAFQWADDLLDVTADGDSLGKAAGKDAGRGKATLVALHGPDEARRRLTDLVDEAAALLEPCGDDARFLLAAARFAAERPR